MGRIYDLLNEQFHDFDEVPYKYQFLAPNTDKAHDADPDQDSDV